MKKSVTLLITCVFLLMIILTGCGGTDTASSGTEKKSGNNSSGKDVIEWNFSIWGGARAWTYPVEDWAKAMSEQTDGKWKINIHYGEALGPAAEQLDGLSNGLFEAAAIAPFYTPGKLPLQQVMDLPFISPLDHKELMELLMAVWDHPEIKKEMDSWNIKPLFPGMPTQYEYMGVKKIEKAEDFKGVKISGMSAEQGQVFELFGAVPTPMPAPELYSSLERGTIDGAIFPYSYTFGSYNLFEVAKYNTVGIAAGSPISTFFVNKDAWEALPDDFKQMHETYVKDVFMDNSIKYYEEADKKWIKEFEDKGVEIITLPKEERQKFLDKSQVVWDKWVEQWKDRGPTQEILDFVLEKRKEISGF